MEAQANNKKGWIIVGYFTFFMILMTFNLVLYPANAPEAMKLYGISQAGITTISSVTSVVGLLAGFIFGPIIDKKGSRHPVLICMLLGVICFYLRVFTVNFSFVIILTFFSAFFVGICQVDAPKILDTWFTKDKVGTAVAFQAGGSGLGGAVAFYIANAIHLRGCLLLIAVANTILLIAWIFIGRDGPIAVKNEKAPEGAVKTVYKSRYVWLDAIAYAMCMTGTMLINTYIVNAFLSKGLPPKTVALMGTSVNLSLFVGGYLATALFAKVKRYNFVLAICVIGGAIGYLGCWFLPYGPQTWIFLILGGLIQGGGILMCVSRTPLIPLTGEYTTEMIGTASGVLETIRGIISFLLPIIVATIFGTNFNAIFIIFGVFDLIALLCGTILVPEVGPNGKLYKNNINAINNK